MLSTVQLNHSNHGQDMVPENSFRKINNFRNDEHGPYSNTQQEDYTPYDANFEIANRAFYATINKFTRQACPDTSTRRRSPPYSFLENWHLHSIYSKSQQTLLGITPVKPSVLLSGDDFMFTPPFIQEEDEEEEEFYSDEDDEDDNQSNWDFYNLSLCPESNQAGELFSCSSYPPSSTAAATTTPLSYFETTPPSPHTIATTTKQYFYDQQENQGENIWIENDERRPVNLNGFQSLSNLNLLTIQIPPQNKMLDSPSSPEEESSSSSSSSASSSSSDEQLTTGYSPSDSDSVCSSITSEKLDAFFNTADDFDNDADIDDFDDRNQLPQKQQELSSYDLMNLYDTTFPTSEELNRQQSVAQIPTMSSPVTRSSSFKSQSSLESVVSYQSFADLMHPQQPSAYSSFYGSISHSFAFDGNIESSSKKSILDSIVDTFVNNNNNAKDHDALNNEEMGTRPATNERGTALNTIWTSLAIYIMYYWQLLIQFFTRESSPSASSESESLL